MPRTELSDWLLAHIDKTGERRGTFRSDRAFSLAMGLNENTLTKVISRGRADKETLRKIANKMEIDEAEMYRIGGLLKGSPKTADLSAFQAALLRATKDVAPERWTRGVS